MLCLVSHTWREHQSNLRHLELPVASHTGICPADLRLREMDSVWFPCFASANCAGKTNLSQLSSQALHAHSTWNLLQKRQMFFWQKLMFKVSLKKMYGGVGIPDIQNNTITIFHNCWGEFHLHSQVGTARARGLFKRFLFQSVTQMFLPTEQNH